MAFQWSFSEALSVIFKTYKEDFGLAQKQRDHFLNENPIVSKFEFDDIAGLKSGKGQAVIFIHGSPANAMRWAQYLKSSLQNYQFI